MAERRIIRLVVNPTAQQAVEDRVWLASQGFSLATLPRRATWYRSDGLPLHNLPTDPHHRARYRDRGFTLKPPVVESPGYPQGRPLSGRAGLQGTKGVIGVPPGVKSQDRAKVRVPRFVRAVLRVMDGKDGWEGAATELMALLDPYAPPGGRPYRVFGMPLDPARLSKKIMGSAVTAALENSGLTVNRGYRGHERVLRLSRR